MTQPARVERRSMADPSGLDRGRSAGLDGLRAVAAVLVLLFHVRTVNSVDFGPINPMIDGGSSGVYLFFALSGYLLYKPFIRGPVDMLGYAAKRAGRLIPGYFVALIGLTLVTGNHLAVDHPLPFLTITSSYDIPLRSFLGNAWTLSAEILFYVTLPLLARVARGREVLVLGLLAVLSMVAAWVHRLGMTEANVWLIGTYPLSFYAFVPGMLLALAEVGRPGLFHRIGTTPWLILGIALLILGTFMTILPVSFATSLGSPLVMAWVLQHRLSGGRLLAFAGGASYALYLWHKDLLIAFGPIGAVIAVGAAIASWLVVERPILSIVHAFAGRRRHTIPAGPVPVPHA